MKKNLQLIAFTFVAMFLFANSGIAQFAAQKLDHPVSVPSDKEGEGVWIHYDSGESDNALGLTGEGPFQSAIRWEPADLADFDGMHITSIRVFINDLPNAAAVIIYQGADAESLDQVYFQGYEPVEESWNEIVLNDPVAIDASLELWISSQVTDPGEGFFPSGMDTTIDDAVGFGNMVNLGSGWDILTDLANIPGVFSLQAFVEPAPAPADDYMVTFRVNMGPATVDGFDPAEHSVFLTGDFLGWAEPGTEGSVELTMEADTKEEVVIWEEHFGAADASGALPEGWTQKKANNALGNDLQDLVDGDTRWWKYSEEYDMGYSSGFNPDWIHTGEASLHINWNVEAEQNVYAITPLMELPEADEMFFEFWMYFSSAYHTEMNVLMSVDGEAWVLLEGFNSTDQENLYTSAVVIDITGQEGMAQFAFVYKWTDGIQMNVDAIKVYGTVSEEPEPDDVFYSATLEVAAGEIAYKYFSDAFVGEDEDGWQGGEWEGDPNRSATIDADMILDDIWAFYEVSVQNVLAETGLNLFPNPVRNTLYVENTAQINEVRIYDLTGRLVMSQVVNNNTASVNVSEFNRGVYIMQVISENGVAAQKFNVIK